MITQGNWIARIENPGTGIDVIEEKTGFGVVWLGTEHELKECEYPLETAKANARLIAAAPDLLNAIQYYFDVLEEVRGKDFDKHPNHVLAKMLNAVKKVREGS
jgi:hypothetical protein